MAKTHINHAEMLMLIAYYVSGAHALVLEGPQMLLRNICRKWDVVEWGNQPPPVGNV